VRAFQFKVQSSTFKLQVAALCFCVSMISPGLVPAVDIVDRVLASVSGRIVTMSDVRTAREFGLIAGEAALQDTRVLLERLIDRILILDEVERYAPPEPRDDDIKARLDVIRDRFNTDDAFAVAMKLTGTDQATLTQWVRNDLRIEAYLNQRFANVVEPTGEDLERSVREMDAAAERSGRTLSDDQVKRLARESALAERRQALIREWIQGLRRRASISYTQADH
jgi:hypothetical protein